MLLSQVQHPDGSRAVAVRHLTDQHGGERAGTDPTEARLVPGADSTRALALSAIAAGRSLAAEVQARGAGDALDLLAALSQGRVLVPLDHPDPAHLHLTGTGLTHLGSAAARDAMHQQQAGDAPALSAEVETEAEAEAITDSMRMFRLGLAAGRPAPGRIGAQPEWFYKGNGSVAIAPSAPLVSPGFALDAGEEPEIAGLYVIAADGQPHRLGFAIGNEFSDHVTERGNYLWLAHSKLRPASFGPEMWVGHLPDHVEGISRVIRDGRTIWEKPFVSGEANMSHSLANLEHHHFKYAMFRQPGDVHVHFFGTATLSFADGIAARDGDTFEIACGALGLPLRNPLVLTPADETPVRVAVM